MQPVTHESTNRLQMPKRMCKHQRSHSPCTVDNYEPQEVSSLNTVCFVRGGSGHG